MNLRKDVFERRTSTGSGLSTFLSGIFAQIFGQIVSIIRKRRRITNLVLTIYFKMKKISLLVDLRRLKTPLLKPSFVNTKALFTRHGTRLKIRAFRCCVHTEPPLPYKNLDA